MRSCWKGNVYAWDRRASSSAEFQLVYGQLDLRQSCEHWTSFRHIDDRWFGDHCLIGFEAWKVGYGFQNLSQQLDKAALRKFGKQKQSNQDQSSHDVA